MSSTLPNILTVTATSQFPATTDVEITFLKDAKKLLDVGFPDHALLNIWNASVHNLRRRVELYGIELFNSAIKDESGRKKYEINGETLTERWASVDDLVLINGAIKLGVLNKKAGKALEMINWMRNHASPAHASDSKVEAEDVFGIALILQKNLFESDMPDPGHSPSGLFEPIKKSLLSEDELALLKDQISAFKLSDVRITFGFLLDMICKGESPSVDNAQVLFNDVWKRANEDLKCSAGQRYHTYMIDKDSDTSSDKGAKIRVLEALIKVDGVKYIPDAARAGLFRRAAKKLASAKNTPYGWSEEVKASKALIQFGISIPSIAFEDVYQEVLSVICGNFWGRSEAYEVLKVLFGNLNTTQLMNLARLFKNNSRVTSELFQSKPKKVALSILSDIQGKITIQSSKDEIDEIIEYVKNL
ncbi:hypothetical protein [Acinetobacter gerneri]|uniref:hypothetical protein n=1 Tax=Acinetobacter gerneri TaxID=202952 RepID=UPI0028B21008|nr:hypothetical protein [Acinetobacter gerneri]